MKRRYRLISLVLGSAHVEYTVSIAFAAVVFFTGRSWIMPLAQWGVPGLGEWLGMFSDPMRLLICGLFALTIIVPLVLGFISVTRKF